MTTTICELKASANGSSRAVLQQNGQDVEWKATAKTTMPWQPNSYDIDSNTLDFCFRPTAQFGNGHHSFLMLRGRVSRDDDGS